jgi:hypothetical protein
MLFLVDILAQMFNLTEHLHQLSGYVERLDTEV